MGDLNIKSEENLSFEERAKILVSKMTLDEKVSQMLHNSSAIERLDIPSYNWWNEALHGVARAGIATVFPQAIGLAATFNKEEMQAVGDIISTEGRAKYHEFQRQGDHGVYKGLTFWSPNVNIFRDPRWGRGQETYGEDPFLTAELGKAYVRGMQGSHDKYLKVAACAKHYAVHSGPEAVRHSFDVRVNAKDLRETYLYAFEELVKNAKVEGVMGAYNAVNGEPCCGSKTLLVDILRNEWGFDGYVASDCWAIKDFHINYHVTDTSFESAALAAKNGCNLNCGNLYGYLLTAVNENLITEEDIDQCVFRLMVTRFRLGMFDDQKSVPYSSIPYSKNACKEHKQMALKAAENSMVLLKNDGILPLNKNNIKSIAVIGPNADSRTSLIGNYHGTAGRYITALEGLQDYLGEDKVHFAEGCHLFMDKTEFVSVLNDDRTSEAVSAAEYSDAVILCLGLDETIEGEETDESNAYGSGDKSDLLLPKPQRRLLDRILEVGKPTVVVLFSGSALAVDDARINALVQAWYPGEQGGKALANLLFGWTNFSAKLPVTFYKSTDDLPPFEEYSMKNRTYRYFEGEPLYPFGFGLSYTRYEYMDMKSVDKGNNSYEIKVCIKNIGGMAGTEIVQLYIAPPKEIPNQPKWALRGFDAVKLLPGEEKEIIFTVTEKELTFFDDDGKKTVFSGEYTVYAGGNQPDGHNSKFVKIII